MDSTVREAGDRGYDVLVVEDGTGSIVEELKRGSEISRTEGGLFGATADIKVVLEAI